MPQVNSHISCYLHAQLSHIFMSMSTDSLNAYMLTYNQHIQTPIGTFLLSHSLPLVLLYFILQASQSLNFPSHLKLSSYVQWIKFSDVHICFLQLGLYGLDKALLLPTVSLLHTCSHNVFILSLRVSALISPLSPVPQNCFSSMLPRAQLSNIHRWDLEVSAF